MAGITADTPDPVDGVIDRDANGEPTGLLLEMSSYPSQRVDTGRSRAKMKQGVTAANRLLLSYGITVGARCGAGEWSQSVGRRSGI